MSSNTMTPLSSTAAPHASKDSHKPAPSTCSSSSSSSSSFCFSLSPWVSPAQLQRAVGYVSMWSANFNGLSKLEELAERNLPQQPHAPTGKKKGLFIGERPPRMEGVSSSSASRVPSGKSSTMRSTKMDGTGVGHGEEEVQQIPSCVLLPKSLYSMYRDVVLTLAQPMTFSSDGRPFPLKARLQQHYGMGRGAMLYREAWRTPMAEVHETVEQVVKGICAAYLLPRYGTASSFSSLEKHHTEHERRSGFTSYAMEDFDLHVQFLPHHPTRFLGGATVIATSTTTTQSSSSSSPPDPSTEVTRCRTTARIPLAAVVTIRYRPQVVQREKVLRAVEWSLLGSTRSETPRTASTGYPMHTQWSSPMRGQTEAVMVGRGWASNPLEEKRALIRSSVSASTTATRVAGPSSWEDMLWGGSNRDWNTSTSLQASLEFWNTMHEPPPPPLSPVRSSSSSLACSTTHSTLSDDPSHAIPFSVPSSSPAELLEALQALPSEPPPLTRRIRKKEWRQVMEEDEVEEVEEKEATPYVRIPIVTSLPVACEQVWGGGATEEEEDHHTTPSRSLATTGRMTKRPRSDISWGSDREGKVAHARWRNVLAWRRHASPFLCTTTTTMSASSSSVSPASSSSLALKERWNGGEGPHSSSSLVENRMKREEEEKVVEVDTLGSLTRPPSLWGGWRSTQRLQRVALEWKQDRLRLAMRIAQHPTLHPFPPRDTDSMKRMARRPTDDDEEDVEEVDDTLPPGGGGAMAPTMAATSSLSSWTMGKEEEEGSGKRSTAVLEALFTQQQHRWEAKVRQFGFYLSMKTQTTIQDEATEKKMEEKGNNVTNELDTCRSFPTSARPWSATYRPSSPVWAQPDDIGVVPEEALAWYASSQEDEKQKRHGWSRASSRSSTHGGRFAGLWWREEERQSEKCFTRTGVEDISSYACLPPPPAAPMSSSSSNTTATTTTTTATNWAVKDIPLLPSSCTPLSRCGLVAYLTITLDGMAYVGYPLPVLPPSSSWSTTEARREMGKRDVMEPLPCRTHVTSAPQLRDEVTEEKPSNVHRIGEEEGRAKSGDLDTRSLSSSTREVEVKLKNEKKKENQSENTTTSTREERGVVLSATAILAWMCASATPSRLPLEDAQSFTRGLLRLS